MNLVLKWVIVGMVALPAVPASAGPGDAARRLRAASAGSVSLRADPGRGVVRFASMPGGVATHRGAGRPSLAATRFLADYGGLFGLGHPGVATHVRSVSTDALGHAHVDFAETYEGLPVFGASIRVHFDAAGELVRASSAFVPVIDLSVTPSFDEAEAIALALDHVAGASWASSVQTMVFDLGLVKADLPDPRLVYAVEVAGPGVAQTVYVDAHDGTIVLAVSRIHDALTRTVYDTEYGPGFEVWTEPDGPYEGGDAEVAGIIEFTEDTYELFANVSGGFLSYDGMSAPMESVAHAAIECPNANWNGISTNFCSGVSTDDVVGHEWAHGYTLATHELIYAYQPGALNESYSDIFGEAVDQLNGAGLDTPDEARNVGNCSFGGGSSVRWLIGEDTVGFGGAIRDMWAPTCMGHPGRIGDFEYVCTGPDFFDNGGVHSNSGVSNHAFALLVDGGVDNGQVVPAIGMTRALAIYWRAMTVYQNVVSGFADHADALTASCADLAAAATELPNPVDGTPSGQTVALADCDAVAAAIAATELYDDPGCGSGTLLQVANVPAACPGVDDPEVVFAEDFEGDLSAWTTTNFGVAPEYEPRDWMLAPELPDGRAGQGVFANGDLYIGDCGHDNQSGVMFLDSPAFTVPEGEDDVVLSFDHWVATQPRIDGGNLSLSVDGGAFEPIPDWAFSFNGYNDTLDASDNPLQFEDAFSGSDPGVPTGTWARSHVLLSSLAGPASSVVLRFSFGVDDCNGLFGWYVDDVTVRNCAAAAAGTGSDTGSDTTGSPGDGTSSGGADESTTGGEPPDPTMDPVATDDGPAATEGSSTGDAQATDGGDGGCGCRGGSGPVGGAWWAVVAWGWHRRRRAPRPARS